MRAVLFFLSAFFLINMPAHALTKETLRHDGLERVFFVHVPEALKGQLGSPMVMALHGGGGSAEQFANHIKMQETAYTHGFILVYPQGTAKRGNMHTWNAGKCCGYAKEQGIDDVGYISALIDVMARKYGIDNRRVYATGHSNGAMMSYRLACELSNKITAIAPNGGQDMKRISCPMQRPVPVLHIHGKADQCAKYDGSDYCGGCFQNVLRAAGLPAKESGFGKCYPVPQMVAQWGRFNGCSGAAQTMLKKGDVKCEAYSGCVAGASVTLCSVENAGHTWPGADKSLKACERRPEGKICTAWKAQVGPVNYDINANHFIWDFFSKYSM